MMNDKDLQKIWSNYDQKLDALLAVNKAVAMDLTRQKLSREIGRMNRPKWLAVVIGIPYTIMLIAVTMVATLAQAYLVAIGFGAIALIMLMLLGAYFYQLYLIGQVQRSETVLATQQQLAELELSSIRSLHLAVFQLPFWSLCWVSIDALLESPLLYGGVNLMVFLLLGYAAFWIYQQLAHDKEDSRIRTFFMSGSEWEPIHKSQQLLTEIRAYEREV